MVTRSRRRGFTMMELMMVVAILGIIASVGANILIQANRYWLLTRTRNDLQREARAAMYVITRELRQAKNATIVLDRLSASQPFYSRLTFATIDGRTFSFQQSGNKLQQVAGSNTSTLSTHLVYLAFTFPQSDDLSIISVSMTLQEATFEGKTKALHMSSEEVQVMN